MIDVHRSRLTPNCAWPDDSIQMRVRAIDVARAAALTLSAGPGRSLARRAVHATAVALEVFAHLKSDAHGDGLHAVGLDSLDASARAEVVHRIGVGLGRVVAERSVLALTDFYNLDALAADPTAPVTVVRRTPRARRRPDFAGCDDQCTWSLLEVKGRTQSGSLRAVREKAVEQVQAVDLTHRDGRPLTVANRIACVSRLSGRPIAVFADDPPADSVKRTIAIDPLELVSTYYELPRALIAEYGGRGPGLSGAESFVGLPLGHDLLLGVHRSLVPILDDPEAVAATRGRLQGEFLEL